jgi:hypothetical protein
VAPSKPAAEERRRLADRLALTDRAGFIGRAREREVFREALTSADRPAILLVYGTGGVGKTTLLREFARMAAEAGRPVVAIDARHLRPSRQGVLQAFGAALGVDRHDARRIPLPDRSVVLIDTYERLRALDGWLRDTFLPGFPDGVLVVLAGRDQPAREWSTDIAWSPLTKMLHLQNFAADESAGFLASRGVAEASHATVLDFTHGHPLALSLVADIVGSSGPDATFDPVDAPDIVQHLLGLFLDVVPAGCRDALDIAAIARVTTERLLADLLGEGAGREAFEWLRAQRFIERSPLGLFPHDLARDVLAADARWRHPDRFHRLARRVYSTLHAHVAGARGRDRQRLQLDALYATRTTPTNLSFFDWRALDDVYLEAAGGDDGEWIVEIVRRHEGAESAALARRWWQAQPDAFHVCHDGNGRFGFVTLLDLTNSAQIAGLRDPAVDGATRFVARHAPVGSGEGVVYLRWWMHAEAYQGVTAAINLAAMHVISHCVTRPRLAWNFVAMSDPQFWAAHFQGVNFARVPEADFAIGVRTYGVFAHEWRIDPPADWLMDTRTPMPFGVNRGVAQEPSPLGDNEFWEAVRAALRDYTSPDRLAANPLTSTRLVGNEPDADAPGRALQRLLRQAAETLDANPRDRKLFRVVRYTYLEPLATQELVAERLDLPFSTYRHQLGRAITRIAAWLRLRERARRRD